MPRSTVQSYQARVSAMPPLERSFPVTAAPEAALAAAKDWVEDQVRTFLVEHSLPHELWHAGAIFAVAEGRSEQPAAQLTLHSEEDEYVFDWDEME